MINGGEYVYASRYKIFHNIRFEDYLRMRVAYLNSTTGYGLDLYKFLMYRVIIPRINRHESAIYLSNILFNFKNKNKILFMYKDPFIYLKPNKQHLKLFQTVKVTADDVVCPFDNAYQMLKRRPAFTMNRFLILNLLCNKIYPKYISDESLKKAFLFNHYYKGLKRPALSTSTALYLLQIRTKLNSLQFVLIDNFQIGWIRNKKLFTNLNTFYKNFYQFTYLNSTPIRFNNYLTQPHIYYKLKTIQAVMHAAHITIKNMPHTLLLSWIGVKNFQKLNYPLRKNPFTYILIQSLREGEHHWGLPGDLSTNVLHYAGTVPAKGLVRVMNVHFRFINFLYMSLCDFYLYGHTKGLLKRTMIANFDSLINVKCRYFVTKTVIQGKPKL
jgi:hypothetical protein